MKIKTESYVLWLLASALLMFIGWVSHGVFAYLMFAWGALVLAKGPREGEKDLWSK